MKGFYGKLRQKQNTGERYAAGIKELM